MTGLKFLDGFKKSIAKIDTINSGLGEPQTWISTGNYALNRSLSGDFTKGIPLGRITLFAGPPGAGKSFISSNCMKEAQDEGFHLLVLDSENAIDIDFLTKIGVDISEDGLTYFQVTTIEDVNRICSEFFQAYIKAYGKNNSDGPKILLVIDSLAMLSTTTEFDNYAKDGTIKSDQGIRAKRSKSMLRMIVGSIARLPIACICTDHVYPQDIMLGDGAWAITNSTKYSSSIIGLVTKLKLKDEKDVIGVRMRFETYKSRFARLGTKIELEVPYNTGMSPFSGLVDMLVDMGVIAKGTQVGEKTKYICEVDGQRLAFKDGDLTEEMCQLIFKHPKATPVVISPDTDMDPEDFEVSLIEETEGEE
jgi:RecA/RadA recombinase